MKTYWKKIISIGQSLLALPTFSLPIGVKKSVFRFIFSIFLLLVVQSSIGFVFISTVYGQPDENLTTKDTSKELSIIISTTGPVKFRSRWFDEPPRLRIEFLTTNVLSSLEKEVIIPKGLIKKIQSHYEGRGQNKFLKSLTFELLEKVSYQISQEENKIVLELNASSQGLESGFLETFIEGKQNKEISQEKKDSTIQRLELMDTTLARIKGIPKNFEEIVEIPPVSVKNDIGEEISKAKEEILLSDLPIVPSIESKRKDRGQGVLAIVFWIAGASLLLGCFFFLEKKWKLTADRKIKELNLQIQEINQGFTHERTIRKAVEQAALEKEKEYEQIKHSVISLNSELQQKKNELIQKQNILGETQKTIGQMQEDNVVLEELGTQGQSSERRESPRLTLLEDFTRTIIVSIKPSHGTANLRAFADNISAQGLSFKAKREFKESDLVNLRLLFYSSTKRMPLIKIRGTMVWKKPLDMKNCYGISFEAADEKDRQELNQYLDSELREWANSSHDSLEEAVQV